MASSRLSLALLVLATSGLAQDTIKEWPKVKEAATAWYRTTYSGTTVLKIGQREVTSNYEVHTEESRSVTRVHPDGSFDLEIQNERVWGTISGSQYKTPVTFDNAKGKSMHPAAKAYVKNLEQTIVVTVDRDFKVQSTRRRNAEGKLGEPDSHAQDLKKLDFIRRVQGPITVGMKWLAPEGIHECTADGCIELTTNNTLVGIDAKTFTVASTASATHQEDQEPQQKIERTLTISRQDGLLLSMQVTASNQSPGLDKNLRMEIERLPAMATETPEALAKSVLQSLTGGDHALYGSVAAPPYEMLVSFYRGALPASGAERERFEKWAASDTTATEYDARRRKNLASWFKIRSRGLSDGVSWKDAKFVSAKASGLKQLGSATRANHIDVAFSSGGRMFTFQIDDPLLVASGWVSGDGLRWGKR